MRKNNLNKEEQEDTIRDTKILLRHNELLINQCNKWLPEEEGLKNLRERNKKSQKRLPFLSMLLKAFIAVSLYLLFLSTAQAQNIDSLYTVFSNSKGVTQINAANEIMRYSYENELGNMITLKTSDEQAFINATVYGAMGMYYAYQLNNYEKGIDFFKLSVENNGVLGKDTAVNIFNGYIASFYARMGDYENALEYNMRCYEWEKRMNDYERLSSTLHELGFLYSQWQKPDMAIRYFEEAMEMERPLNRPMYYAIRLVALAKVYAMTDPAKALPLIKEALQYDEMIELKVLKEDRLAIHSVSLGDVYYALDSLENAERCYKNSLATFERKGHKNNQAKALFSLGKLQVKSGRYSEAVATLKRCDAISEENKYLGIQRDACLLLSEAYNKLEPNALSYIYLKKYVALDDSIFTETTQQLINEYQVKYETAEKQLEIERQQTEISRHQSRQYMYIGIISATGLLLVMLIYIVALRTRRNQALAEMNATKDKFFSIISHDLQNPTIAQRNALQALIEHADKMDAAALKQYYAELLKSTDSQVGLLHDLLNWAKLQSNRMNFNPQQFNLKALIDETVGVLKTHIDSKHISLIIDCPDKPIIIFADRIMLATILRNLLTNAAKFTPEGGEIRLHAETRHAMETRHAASLQGVTISVEDNGLGMDEETRRNLFRLDRQHSHTGTAGEQGSGLGLIVCKELIEKNGGTMSVESEAGKGSKLTIEL